MNYCPKRQAKWALLAIIIFLPLLWVCCSAEGEGTHSLPAYRRLRRQSHVCQDGTYSASGKTCCRCSAGERLTQDCETEASDRRCESCVSGKTYKSGPNNDRTCEPCTSCGHSIAHLEVKEDCTPAKDAVCQCQEGFYCPSQPCTICNLCEKCVDKIVKTPCSRTNNTICEVKTEGHGLVVSLIVAAILLILIVCVIMYFWKKKLFCFNSQSEDPPEGHHGSRREEILLMNPEIPDGDLTPKIADIAAVIGWADMKHIAMASGMPQVSIEGIMRDNQTCNEQTIDLLQKWTQRMGKAAPGLLVKALRKIERIDTMEKVQDIILQN